LSVPVCKSEQGHLQKQVPRCIICSEDDRKRVPIALGYKFE